MLLEAVPQLQEVLAVAAQLAGHLGRGLARRDAVEDEHDLGGAAVRPLHDGPGPGVEDAAAVAALVVQDRLAVPVMDPQVLPLAARGTGQAIGVEERDEFAVAGVLIQIGDQGEIHRVALRATGYISLDPNAIGCGRQDAGHLSGPMSQSQFRSL
jgi:hypothetical protein